MSRWTLFVLSGVAAMLAIGMFVYSSWLRIIQTGDPDVETWTPVVWFIALVLLIAGLIRRG